MAQGQVCLVPRLKGLGGMVSFQARLAAGLSQRGVAVSYDLDDPSNRAILVIGGTRQVAALWRARQRGVRIVQRLNGMNWIHRKQKTTLRAFLQVRRQQPPAGIHPPSPGPTHRLPERIFTAVVEPGLWPSGKTRPGYI